MIVSCPSCGSRYNIPANRIGDSPKRFRCRKCSEVFVIESPKSETPETPPLPVHGDDSEHRAMRFARVLASDMLIYNRELVERARLEGTLQREMGQEILRSWELWKNRFPKESADEPELFRDALNHFLGDGEDLFGNWSPQL
jgi:predicted Zn finger-like uncharacterized protein